MENKTIYGDYIMTKYTKTIALETIDGFKLVKFATSECDSKEEVDKELKLWLKDYPELLKIENNKKIIELVLNGE